MVSFTTINGQARPYLAALDATTGTLIDWDPHPNGGVAALAMRDTTLYVGGGFSQIGTQVRHDLAAIDASTGRIIDWHPDVDGVVGVLAIDGTTLYAGGDFTSVDGWSRSCVAAVDAHTGGLISWGPHIESAGRCLSTLTAADGVVYAGGPFTSVDGTPHAYITALSMTLHRMVLPLVRR